MSDQDYLLSPTEHAEKVKDTMPTLLPLLRGEALGGAAVMFEDADGEAKANQRRFRRWARAANGGVAGATFLAAAALAVPEGWQAKVLGGLGGVAGVVGTVALTYLRSGDLLKGWMQARAQAESQRLNYFRQVVAAVRGGSPTMLKQALDYICKFQLEVQLAYYKQRGEQHKALGHRLLLWGAIASGFGALGALFSGLVAPWLALIGVAGAALAGLVTAQEAMGQDMRNAERYARTRTALMEVKGLLDQVRPKVEAGDAEALELWVGTLHEHLSVEHREWLAQGESTKSMLAQLQDKLKAPTPTDGQG